MLAGLEDIVSIALDLEARESVRPAFTCLMRTGLEFRDLPPTLRENRDFVIAALRAGNQAALGIAVERFGADKEVVLAAVAQDGMALGYVSAELQSDPAVVRSAQHR